MFEQCAICGCRVHRVANTYAQPSIAGRSHAYRHYYVPERFFGRTKTRRGVLVEGIFPYCPWEHEGKSGLLCYECHSELLGNPVLLPQQMAQFADLVKHRGLREEVKTESREPIAGRVALLHDVIALGLAASLKKEVARARLQALRELAPFLGGFAAIFLLVGFSPWIETYSASESIAIEGWVFFLAGLMGCALSPGRPFRAAFMGTAGVLAGTAAGIVAHEIVSNALGNDPHRAFSPLMIATHAGMSAPSMLLSALIWKAGSSSFFWDLSHLKEFADGRIAAHRRKILDCLLIDIATLKTRIAANGAFAGGCADREVVSICSNALYALAETVLTQYDGIVAELLVPNPLAVERLMRSVPLQLQPLFDECLAQVRREANLAGTPETTTMCVATLKSRFSAICDDVALTLKASLAERYRTVLGELKQLLHRFSERLPKFAWSLHRHS
ncbi:MAG TPA: hypothetical protein VEE84_05880 [Burkholderiaceae bacterium]|nr:hypothetical protein [Burkholderiaceae bacterium]